mgnify:CR=1 FL=1
MEKLGQIRFEDNDSVIRFTLVAFKDNSLRMCLS